MLETFICYDHLWLEWFLALYIHVYFIVMPSHTCCCLLEPPLFVRGLEAKDVVKGSEMMLEGQVTGSSPFSVSFNKNSKPIRNDKRHRITVKDDLVALQVLAVEAGDVGLYQCTVENEVGSASSDCQVTLKGWFRFYRFTFRSTALLRNVSMQGQTLIIYKSGLIDWIASKCVEQILRRCSQT